MPQTSSPSNPLPVEVFAGLLPALAEQIQNLALSEQPNIEEAAAAFRDKIAEARALVEALPGGDLSLADQEEVIKGLRELKRSKLMQLRLFKEADDSKVEAAVSDADQMDTAPE